MPRSESTAGSSWNAMRPWRNRSEARWMNRLAMGSPRQSAVAAIAVSLSPGSVLCPRKLAIRPFESAAGKRHGYVGQGDQGWTVNIVPVAIDGRSLTLRRLSTTSGAGSIHPASAVVAP